MRIITDKDRFKHNKELFLNYQANPSDALKEKIIIFNTPLIKEIIGRKFNYPSEFDDLLQEGMIALAKCIDNFNPVKGAFSSYFYRAVSNSMINWMTRKSLVKVPSGIRKLAEIVPEDYLINTPCPDGIDSTLSNILQSTTSEEQGHLLNYIMKKGKIKGSDYKVAKKIKKILSKPNSKQVEFVGNSL